METRDGVFRTFFPYRRNGDVHEISNEMGAAWGASRAVDVLEMLVATLAPRGIVLHNTVTGYGNGSETDALGLQAAKFVYRGLGLDADDLVRFNVHPAPAGEPHAEDTPQRRRTAEYLDHYFYGGYATLAPWKDYRPVVTAVPGVRILRGPAGRAGTGR